MSKRIDKPVHEPPVFHLVDFSEKAKGNDFYIETLQDHLSKHEFISKPHKHDFYLILYITKGGGVHSIDFTDYPVNPGSIFLMTPGQVHSWKLAKGTNGFILFFTRAFYQMQMSENNLMDFPFYHSLHASPLIKLKKDAVIDFIFSQLLSEYATSERPDARLLRTYLDLLLLTLGRQTPDQNETKSHGSSYKLRKLEQLIEENFKTLKQPAEYGDLMNLSPTYLNNVCKSNLGKTLTQLIQERILLEAKRLFAYSDLTVNEVSGRLNFNDVSYFVRFFRKNSGFTPEAFRKSLQ